MSWVATAIVGGALVGGVATSIGASKQGKAIDRATDAQSFVQDRMLTFQERIYDEGTEFRRIAEEEAGFDFAQKQAQAKLREELLPDIYKNINLDPTDNPAFRRTLAKGTERLRSLYEPLGLGPESGPTAVATGEFAGSLYGNVFNQSADRNINTLLSLYGRQLPASGAGGQGAQATSTAAGLFNPISNVSSNIGSNIIAGGAVQGNLYGSIGRDISNIGLLYGAGAFK